MFKKPLKLYQIGVLTLFFMVFSRIILELTLPFIIYSDNNPLHQQTDMEKHEQKQYISSR
jgi:hypothetical protein